MGWEAHVIGGMGAMLSGASEELLHLNHWAFGVNSFLGKMSLWQGVTCPVIAVVTMYIGYTA